jgi:tRNA(fMet)-specific endonuclease VapC
MTQKTLLDTDILSALLRQQPVVVGRASTYLETFSCCSFSLISRYEILRGLKAKQAQRQAAAFEAFCAANEVMPVTDAVIERASDIYAALHRLGQLISDADILIAATALEHGWALSTNNENHFSRISGLAIDNWLKP